MLNWGSYGNIINAIALQKANRVSGAFNFTTWNQLYSTYDAVNRFRGKKQDREKTSLLFMQYRPMIPRSLFFMVMQILLFLCNSHRTIYRQIPGSKCSQPVCYKKGWQAQW
jgi:hypothetical protein